ncbi:MAG: HAMP domain-containing sensor histidine kinase, partial [Pseudomonadota bacterium]
IEALAREVAMGKKFSKKIPFFIRFAGTRGQTFLLILPYQWIRFDIKELDSALSDKNREWIILPLEDSRYALEVKSVDIFGGYVLQVGKSTEDREKILKRFREIFTFVMIPLMLCGLAGGLFLTTKALRPIRNLISTVRAIDAGRMDARVRLYRTGDEFEELVNLFNEMLTKIESLIKGMKDSLDNVAHDLRTPMMRLRGTAETALQSGHEEEDLKEALADCMEESDRILTMLNTLMDISEAETGVLNLDLQKMSASEMIEDVAELYRYVAEDKDITLKTSCPKDLYVTADPLRMRQVLGNLLDNAVKYTPRGGRVDIEAEVNAAGIEIFVRDTGAGIAPEELPRIWERLYRGDQSRSQRGLGLGLSLVKAVVQAHRGRVEALSHPGGGSTFRVLLSSGPSAAPSPTGLVSTAKP